MKNKRFTQRGVFYSTWSGNMATVYLCTYMLKLIFSTPMVLYMYLLTSRQANEAELKRENEQLHLQLAEMSILARIRQSEDGEGESSEGKWVGRKGE